MFPAIVSGIDSNGVDICHQTPLFSHVTVLKLIDDTWVVARDVIWFLLEMPLESVQARTPLHVLLYSDAFEALKSGVKDLLGMLHTQLLIPVMAVLEAYSLPIMRLCGLYFESVFTEFRDRYPNTRALVGDSIWDILVLIVWLMLVVRVALSLVKWFVALLPLRRRRTKKPFTVPPHVGIPRTPITVRENIPFASPSLSVARTIKKRLMYE